MICQQPVQTQQSSFINQTGYIYPDLYLDLSSQFSSANSVIVSQNSQCPSSTNHGSTTSDSINADSEPAPPYSVISGSDGSDEQSNDLLTHTANKSNDHHSQDPCSINHESTTSTSNADCKQASPCSVPDGSGEKFIDHMSASADEPELHHPISSPPCHLIEPHVPIATCTLELSKPSEWCGFKIVGDNIDYTIKPRYMGLDHQNQSVHYLNSIAVKDRIDLFSFSDEAVSSPLSPNLATANILLPSIGDDTEIRSNFLFLVKKVVIEHLDYFAKSFGDVTERHISHKYSTEMQKKTEIVSLVLLELHYIIMHVDGVG